MVPDGEGARERLSSRARATGHQPKRSRSCSWSTTCAPGDAGLAFTLISTPAADLRFAETDRAGPALTSIRSS